PTSLNLTRVQLQQVAQEVPQTHSVDSKLIITIKNSPRASSLIANRPKIRPPPGDAGKSAKVTKTRLSSRGQASAWQALFILAAAVSCREPTTPLPSSAVSAPPVACASPTPAPPSDSPATSL